MLLLARLLLRWDCLILEACAGRILLLVVVVVVVVVSFVVAVGQ